MRRNCSGSHNSVQGPSYSRTNIHHILSPKSRKKIKSLKDNPCVRNDLYICGVVVLMKTVFAPTHTPHVGTPNLSHHLGHYPVRTYPGVRIHVNTHIHILLSFILMTCKDNCFTGYLSIIFEYTSSTYNLFYFFNPLYNIEYYHIKSVSSIPFRLPSFWSSDRSRLTTLHNF